jgi:hypothetical protein
MRYQNASNDMARGNERPSRAQAICRLIVSNNVTGFVGTIETLSSNNDGHGVLAVRLSRNMTISTWNNSFSDSSHKTLISNGSPLHRRLIQMRVGQKVSVDGTFFSDNDDCLDEKSISVSGGMREPDFLFKFSNVQALD